MYPYPKHMNINQVAQIIGCDTQLVEQHKIDGFVVPTNGDYHINQVLQIYLIEHLKKHMHRQDAFKRVEELRRLGFFNPKNKKQLYWVYEWEATKAKETYCEDEDEDEDKDDYWDGYDEEDGDPSTLGDIVLVVSYQSLYQKLFKK